MLSLASFNRWQAAGVHLTLSAVIGATVLAAMLFVWYPEPFFDAVGGSRLILLLVGVDVVLGPLLTSVVYNPRKPRLRLDLSIIAVLQSAALIYGVHVMFAARPVYVVFAKDRFDLITANQIDPAEQSKARAPYDSLPLTGPQTVGVRVPEDPAERQRTLFAGASGYDLSQFPQYFVSYASLAHDAAARGRPIADLRRRNPSRAAAIDDLLRRSGRPEDSLRYLAVKAKEQDLAAIVAADSGELVGLVIAYPW